MNKLLGSVFSVEDFPSNLTYVLGFITAEEQGQVFTASKFRQLLRAPVYLLHTPIFSLASLRPRDELADSLI